MQAGFLLDDRHRVDVQSDKPARRIRIQVDDVDLPGEHAVTFSCTPSEARAISSALMGAAAEL